MLAYFILILTISYAKVNGFGVFNGQNRANTKKINMGLSDTHKSLFSKIDGSLKLKLTSYASDCNSWKEGKYSGSCEWWEEKMGGKLTGVSKNTIIGEDGLEVYTINCWMGPAYSIPHMLLTFSSTGSDYSVYADYVTRGPTPIGTDQNMIDNFYGQDVTNWYDKSASKGKVLPPPVSFSARLLQSPIALSVSNLSLQDMESIATEHLDRWLSWIADKEGKGKQVESRSRGGMNSRDDKLRQYAYKSSVSYYSKLLGSAVSQRLGAAATGPISEAYVGGGS